MQVLDDSVLDTCQCKLGGAGKDQQTSCEKASQEQVAVKATTITALLTRLQDAASVYKESISKWFGMLEELPCLMFELGGDDGADFALALLLVFGDELGLNSTMKDALSEGSQGHSKFYHRQRVGFFISRLQSYATAKEEFDTFEFLERVKADPEFRAEVVEFALQRARLPLFPSLYKWVCQHVYGVMTDQQSGESVFSFLDMTKRPNMNIATLQAAIYLEMRKGHPRNSSVELKRKVQRRLKTRPKNYNTVRHILKAINFKEDEAKSRKPRRKTCKNACECCYQCGECTAKQYKVVTRASFLKHYKDKHPGVEVPGNKPKKNDQKEKDDEKEKEKEEKEKEKEKEEKEKEKESESEGEELNQVAEDDRYCVCEQPYDESKFMLECDNCHEWYHLPCLELKGY